MAQKKTTAAPETTAEPETEGEADLPLRSFFVRLAASIERKS